MKITKSYLFLLFVSLFVACQKKALTHSDSSARTSVTFILGQDKSLSNPFYQSATEYYCKNPVEKTSEMVLACHSLAEISAWLQAHRTPNGLPYSIVNIVVHGNPWVGCRIGKDGKRVDSQQIEAAIKTGEILPLTPDKYDAQTEIRLLSCALGKDEALLAAIGHAFAGSGHITVRSPLFFMVYANQKRFLAEYWHIAAKENTNLASQFRQTYPHIHINWEEAIQKEIPDNEKDSYLHTFSIPFRWTFQLADKTEIPIIKDEESCMNWLAQKSEIQAKLAEIHFSISDFHWQYWAEYEENSPTFKVKGLCNVACILHYCEAKKTMNWEDKALYCTIKL